MVQTALAFPVRNADEFVRIAPARGHAFRKGVLRLVEREERTTAAFQVDGGGAPGIETSLVRIGLDFIEMSVQFIRDQTREFRLPRPGRPVEKNVDARTLLFECGAQVRQQRAFHERKVAKVLFPEFTHRSRADEIAEDRLFGELSFKEAIPRNAAAKLKKVEGDAVALRHAENESRCDERTVVRKEGFDFGTFDVECAGDRVESL